VNRILVAISDGTRWKLLDKISEREICVCELPELVEVSQPAVSQHLKVLHGAGLVKVRCNGKNRLYSVTPKGKLVLKDVSRW